MAKLKPNKSATKRVKITRQGKLKLRKPGTRHLLSGKSGNRKRRLHKTTVLSGTIAKAFKKSLWM
ncbi:MAG: 50S ribosomal protein L35 [Planctomycetes bacterium]|nr:50S ribosomal protein L35 [Planctomycetota bacterium]